MDSVYVPYVVVTHLLWVERWEQEQTRRLDAQERRWGWLWRILDAWGL